MRKSYNGITGSLKVDKDSLGLLSKYNGTSAIVDATGMTPAQLNAVHGAIGKVDSIVGEMVFAFTSSSSHVNTTTATALAAKFDANSTNKIKVDASNVNKLGLGYGNSGIQDLVGITGVSEVINIPDDATIEIASTALSGQSIKFSDADTSSTPGGIIKIKVLNGGTDLSGLKTDGSVRFHATVEGDVDLRELGNQLEKIEH